MLVWWKLILKTNMGLSFWKNRGVIPQRLSVFEEERCLRGLSACDVTNRGVIPQRLSVFEMVRCLCGLSVWD